MLLKLLKLKANEAIRSGATATIRSGSVTRREICKRAPPSTRAASVSSAGIDWRAPRQTRKKYGKVSQRLTRVMETFAHHGAKSDGTSMWKSRLTTPTALLRG